MKKTVISLLAMLVSVAAFGQRVDSVGCSSHTVIYEYKINTQDEEGKPVTDVCELVVQASKKVTKCTPMINYLRQKGLVSDGDIWGDKVKGTPFLRAHADITRMHLPIVFTGYPKGKVTTQEMIVPHLYISTDKYRKPQWKLGKDNQTIDGHLCHAATVVYAGKTWHVWYTQDAGISAGPWKLQGLKGLIVSATDEEGIHSFRMKEVRKEQLPILYHGDEWEHHASTKAMKIIRKTPEEMVAFRDSLFGNDKYIQYPLYYEDEETLYKYAQPVLFARDLPEESFRQVCWNYYYVLLDSNGRKIRCFGRKYQPLELK